MIHIVLFRIWTHGWRLEWVKLSIAFIICCHFSLLHVLSLQLFLFLLTLGIVDLAMFLFLACLWSINNYLHLKWLRWFICDVCPLAKQTRLLFLIHSQNSQCKFDLIHCDIWGPFSIPTFKGSDFFFTNVNDCTKFVWVYVITRKSQTRTILQSFVQLVQTQFNLKIKQLRSDNGVEFLITDF